MLRALLVTAILTTMLAGCADKAPTEVATPDAAPEAELVTVTGRVQDLAVVPIGGANVTITERNLTAVTDADGVFQFTDLPKAFYTVRASADGFGTQTLTFSPLEQKQLIFTLPRLAAAPRQVPWNFHGIIQCAAEYVIITPSCDSATQYVDENYVGLPNGGSITEDTTEFAFPVEDGWKTVVADLVFDLEGHPGLEAMRATVSGTFDPNALTDYQQYGRFTDTSTFTFRIEPGGEYADGVEPVPQNSTGFRYSIYSQGYGWHTACDITGDPRTCTLGLGAGIDIEFDLFITIFYGQPAPEGWSSIVA